MAITKTHYATVEVFKRYVGGRESTMIYEGPARHSRAEALPDLVLLAAKHNIVTHGDCDDVYVKCTYHIPAKAVWDLG